MLDLSATAAIISTSPFLTAPAVVKSGSQVLIGLWPEIGSIVLGWGCTLATAIILIVGWKMKVFTPGGKLPKGALYHAKKD